MRQPRKSSPGCIRFYTEKNNKTNPSRRESVTTSHKSQQWNLHVQRQHIAHYKGWPLSPCPGLTFSRAYYCSHKETWVAPSWNQQASTCLMVTQVLLCCNRRIWFMILFLLYIFIMFKNQDMNPIHQWSTRINRCSDCTTNSFFKKIWGYFLYEQSNLEISHIPQFVQTVKIPQSDLWMILQTRSVLYKHTGKECGGVLQPHTYHSNCCRGGPNTQLPCKCGPHRIRTVPMARGERKT